MSAARKAARETYDALVELASGEGGRPTAYALVKQTFALKPDGAAALAAPEPLLYDFRDETQSPRLVAGTDFWPEKEATDVIVRGSAFAPGGKPAPLVRIAASLGAASRRIAVFGRREIRWSKDGAPLIGDAEPFVEMPVTYENAYGGVDARVRPAGEVSLPQWMMAATQVDHPGAYPRNRGGKGYLVLPGEVAGAEMPNLEDPADPLTPERLITGDPALWYRQPLPACFDCVPIFSFPRTLFFADSTDTWFSAPDDARLPEVQRGILSAGCKAARPGGVQPRFFQDACHELTVRGVRGGEPVRIEGMHPEREVVEFDLPAPPSLQFELEGRREPVATRVHSVVVQPAAGLVHIVSGATVALHRTFLPGVHKYIPIAVSVGGDRPVAYEAPPTVRDRLAAAAAAQKGAGA